MKRFLQNTLNVQKLTKEVGQLLFGDYFTDEIANGTKSNRFVVLKELVSPDGFIFQIVIQDATDITNIYYLVIILDKDENYIGKTLVKQENEFPPVFEKTMGLDYYDYSLIQDEINRILVENLKSAPIIKDVDPKDKMIYLTQEPIEQAKKIFIDGGSYGLVAIFAEKFFEKAKILNIEKMDILN
jgi:hypothetical protein